MTPAAASAGRYLPTPLRLERPRAGVLRLVLANPPANALSEAMLDALQAAIDEAADDARSASWSSRRRESSFPAATI